MKQKILSIDAEVDGLYGMAFAIAFTVREDGEEIYSWSGRSPNHEVRDGWVRENVLPALGGMPVTHANSVELEEEFWEQWMQHKEGCTVIAHCGSPVESGLFRRCVERDLDSRQWNAPYPAIHDVATLLLMAGEEPDSIDSFLKKKGVVVEFEGTPHHPMYDAVAAAQAWERIRADYEIKRMSFNELQQAGVAGIS